MILRIVTASRFLVQTVSRIRKAFLIIFFGLFHFGPEANPVYGKCTKDGKERENKSNCLLLWGSLRNFQESGSV